MTTEVSMTRAERRQRLVRVRDDLLSGKAIRDVASEHDLSDVYVRNIAANLGISETAGTRKRQYEMLHRVMNGDKASKVAKEFGITRAGLHRIVKEAAEAGIKKYDGSSLIRMHETREAG